jgi:hypothetical protein
MLYEVERVELTIIQCETEREQSWHIYFTNPKVPRHIIYGFLFSSKLSLYHHIKDLFPKPLQWASQSFSSSDKQFSKFNTPLPANGR